MNLLERVTRGKQTAERSSRPLPMDEFLSYFTFDNLAYYLTGNQTLGSKQEEIPNTFAGMTQGAYKRSSVVYACEIVRIRHFSEARFTFRQVRGGVTGLLFGTQALSLLENPWPGATTGDLLSKMLAHHDLAGNAFVARPQPDRLKILRPDWMTIVVGSMQDPDVVTWDPDSELLGYLYHPGGRAARRDPIPYLPGEIAHFAATPDPEFEYRGMSWLTPVLQEIRGDQAATDHKLKFFENGATPNMVVKLDIDDPGDFQKWIDLFRENYEGRMNAYKTMVLGAGADANVVGANFQQLNFKETVGVSETRIAAAAETPPVMVGLSEGLSGSSLNAGNYGQARRRFADGTMRPLWRNAAGSLATLIDVPSGAELWYDTRDVAFLREDEEVEAKIVSTQAQSIRTLSDGGYDPASVVEAVVSGDLTRLKHTGKLSVQLQEPGANGGNGNGSEVPVEA